MDRPMDNNGLRINDSIYLPPEMLAHILYFVHPPTLVRSCTLVCRIWNETVNKVWKPMVMHYLSPNYEQNLEHPYPFTRNLLRNNCGQDEFEYWFVKRPDYYEIELGWEIEDTPVEAEPLPRRNQDFAGHTSCFSTSRVDCEKYQLIDLRQNGISDYFVDVFRPKIIVSDWYAGRNDCGCRYRLKVQLRNEVGIVLHEKRVNRKIKQWKGRKWQKVYLMFQNYSPGVRFIIFNHSGRATQCFARAGAGHYGSKMAGGAVRLSLSKPTE